KVGHSTYKSHASFLFAKRLPCGSTTWDPSRNQHECSGLRMQRCTHHHVACRRGMLVRAMELS
ncbi:MAG: hypothetical protein ACK578_27060, partial [Pirellula sp.]